MISTSRRQFLLGLATAPMLFWLPHGARAAVPLVRYDAASPPGLLMLQVYADAVNLMKMRAEGDPLGWLWQWYTHFVDGTTSKSNEITRIFGGTASATGNLANETWNTCQSHAGQNANNFLPWHRMFVYFFESIVREVSGRPDFTLPYWNYTSYDPAKRGIVPLQFRSPDDPIFASLYRPDRTTLANSGQPIHRNQPGDAMDISVAMAKGNYSSVGSVQGFCRAIDSGIHGKIHVLVGTSRNMGAVPYAARDPLFWVHHASIDRMWASWNRNGGANPTNASWARRLFAFADANGQRVTGRLRDYFSTDALGYTYDSFITASGTEAAPLAMLQAEKIGRTTERVARAAQPARLGASAVSVELRPAVGVRETQVLGLDTTSGKRVYLVIKDLHAWSQPEVLYHVYLRPGRGAGAPGPASFVGSINFFDAQFHDHGSDTLDTALSENFFSFDVTEILRRIGRSGTRNARKSLLVTFVPGGRPAPGADPLVATVELQRQ